MTVPEVRRLWRLPTADAAEWQRRLAWLRWRQAHQTRAKRGHMRRRQRAGAPAHAEPTVIVVAGTPALTDAHWAQVVALLPPQKRATGRPAEDHRRIIDGMLWVMRHGTGWRFLPEQFGPWQTVYTRYQRWSKDGLWRQIMTLLHAQAMQLSDASKR